jgi:hypothetical protein
VNDFFSSILVTRIEWAFGHEHVIVGLLLVYWTSITRQNWLVCNAVLAVFKRHLMVIVLLIWLHLVANLSDFLLNLALCHI